MRFVAKNNAQINQQVRGNQWRCCQSNANQSPASYGYGFLSSQKLAPFGKVSVSHRFERRSVVDVAVEVK